MEANNPNGTPHLDKSDQCEMPRRESVTDFIERYFESNYKLVASVAVLGAIAIFVKSLVPDNFGQAAISLPAAFMAMLVLWVLSLRSMREMTLDEDSFTADWNLTVGWAIKLLISSAWNAMFIGLLIFVATTALRFKEGGLFVASLWFTIGFGVAGWLVLTVISYTLAWRSRR